jgi:hypothetical protein
MQASHIGKRNTLKKEAIQVEGKGMRPELYTGLHKKMKASQKRLERIKAMAREIIRLLHNSEFTVLEGAMALKTALSWIYKRYDNKKI